MSKIVITGHTKGIGQALTKLYTDAGHEVLGCSRTNHYDMMTEEGRDKIIAHHTDCDIFVNNAFADQHQITLFKAYYEQWRYDNTKTIVNINSRAKYGAIAGREYSMVKKMLHKEWVKILEDHGDRLCRIININPGYVDTEMLRHPTAKSYGFTHEIMQPETLAGFIKFATDQPHHIEIGDFSVWHTTVG